MYKDIKDLLDIKFKHLKFDKKLFQQLQAFRISWMQKSEDYMLFLGGNSLGVQPIRFSSRDDDILFADILNVDIDDLKTEILKVKHLDPKWKTASNPLYQSLGYIMHRFHTSKDIGKYKEEAILETFLIFSYKVIGSLVAHYFKFNTTPEIAKAVYERLSNRYLIKKLNTWQDVFIYRSKDVIDKQGLHYKRILRYNTDDSVRILNDVQGRIRELVKNIYLIMMEIIENDTKIRSSSLIESGEDGESTGEITERPDKYIAYMRDIISNPNSFIDDDLIYLLTTIIPNIDISVLKTTLIYISEEVEIKPESDDDFIYVSIVKTINYNYTKGINNEYRSNIMEILKNMRGFWSSSSVKDKDVKHIKKHLYNLTRKAIDRKTNWLLTTTTIGILLYIFLRAIVKK